MTLITSKIRIISYMAATIQAVIENKQLFLKGVKNNFVAVGMDYDSTAIRAVMASCTRKGDISLEALEEVRGSFGESATLEKGLKQLSERLPSGAEQCFISCLGGRQVYANQISFKKDPTLDMDSALRQELSKFLPFEAQEASLDYQSLTSQAAQDNTISLLVAAASKECQSQHLQTLASVNIKPRILDILPLAMSNALFMVYPMAATEHPCVILHVGPDACTVVIDGQKHPFFYRAFYFNTQEGGKKLQQSYLENPQNLKSFTEEVSRTLAYYSSTFWSKEFSRIYLTGSLSTYEPLTSKLKKEIGLNVSYFDLCALCGRKSIPFSAKFDIPIILALRGLMELEPD